MKKLIKIILPLLSLITYSQEKEILQQNQNFDIYIFIDKISKSNITKIKDKDIYYENYRLSWPSSINYKKMSLKVNEKGDLISSISILGSSKNVNLTYKNEQNKNSPIRVKKDQILNIIKYDDFVYYENDLIEFFKNARNLYVILENDSRGNYYMVKKVELIPLGNL